MKTQNRIINGIVLFYFISSCFNTSVAQNLPLESQKRKQHYLDQLYQVLLPDNYRRAKTAFSPTPEDSTWTAWQKRTGELPPDFKKLPSLPFLPDPLVLEEGREDIPVRTMEQWKEKRAWIKEQAQYWITGKMPPKPEDLKVTVLKERKINDLIERDVRIEFGPDYKAQLHITLLMPPGKGPFPVFIAPWKKDRYDWVQAAVRRGYIGVRFTATDPKYGFPDDSEVYEKLWWPEYDFSAIARWAWAASRTIDYLYLLPEINKDQIALTGLSRNGKMALWAAAYDERIKAVVPISGGTGGENPFRYTSDPYNTETIELLTRVRPHWLHPRLRFFVGRESKLPVDMNLLMALVAPRGLMLTSSITESAGNHYGIEQAYFSAKRAYDFVGAGENIAIDLRYGLHAPASRDVERYLDFFDFVFSRNDIKPQNELFFDYSFSKWRDLSGEAIDPLDFEVKGVDDLLVSNEGAVIDRVEDWEDKKEKIIQNINWIMGENPPSLGPSIQPDYMGEVVGFPKVGNRVGFRDISFGKLYYPSDKSGNPVDQDIPVVIFLHEYSYSTGFSKASQTIREFTDNGIAVYMFDQIGFGTRIEEGTHFYNRFPNWSKLGRMVADVSWAFDELTTVDYIDLDNVFVAGYSLGGTVALYSAAMDDRIAGVVSISGFTPLRLDRQGKTAEGIYRYSHLHGLLPKLGFFAGEENRVPFDYHEVLGTIATRPVLIVAPSWDQFNSSEDVKLAVDQANKVYKLYDPNGDEIQIDIPEDYNRFSPKLLEKIVKWVKEKIE